VHRLPLFSIVGRFNHFEPTVLTVRLRCVSLSLCLRRWCIVAKRLKRIELLFGVKIITDDSHFVNVNVMWNF